MWLSALHTEATLQLLLSAAGACLRQRAAPSWLRRLLQLMGEIAAKPRGAAALLAHDLAQQLWLPLAHAAGIYSPFALVDARVSDPDPQDPHVFALPGSGSA